MSAGQPAGTDSEHGRIQIVKDAESGTVTLIVENVNREGEHWLTLASIEAPHRPIGYLRLRPLQDVALTTARHLFEIAELRPADGPMLQLPTGPSPSMRERVLAGEGVEEVAG